MSRACAIYLRWQRRLTRSPSILKHRNFDPESRQAKKRATKADADGDAVMEDTVEKSVAGLAERIVAEDEERRAQELDVFNIAPKRANWDLKRDMEKKVARLERRTQEAIHTLIRALYLRIHCALF